MSKKEEIKATYLKDIQMAASKSKFGFFNVPPPVSAGDQIFQQKTITKDENGKVKTQERNIFSGLCATGILKKTMFQYTPSYTPGDVYQDPGKVQRVNNLKTSEKFKQKQTFKPCSLSKTMMNSSYEYVPQKEQRKDPKQFRNQDGKVKSQNPNITCTVTAKIQYKRLKQNKYVGQNYQNAKMLRRKEIFDDIAKRGEGAFKLSSPAKPYFASLKQQFGEVNVPQKKQKVLKLNIMDHDSRFRPSNRQNKADFSYPEYKPIGNGRQQVKKIQKGTQQKKEPFKLMKKDRNSRPSPSVSLSKMNLMRSMR